MVIGVSSASVFDFMETDDVYADVTDEIFEPIGGDDFLNATLVACKKLSEKNISDDTFITSDGTFKWYDAKNISYVDSEGNHGYIIVWKASPDKYDFNTFSDVNIYYSSYLLDRDAKSFIEYSYEDKQVYGIVLGTDEINYNEADLVYGILGLNRSGFELVYSGENTPSVSSDSTSNHYSSVVGDRYSVAKNDPDSYYDYYEYGDNYDIDNYLESEGYD